MKLRVVRVLSKGLSTKVLASVAAALVADAGAWLALRGVTLGPELEGAVLVLVTAGLVGLAGYLVPEASE